MTRARNLKTHRFRKNLSNVKIITWFWSHKAFRIRIDHGTLEV
jgi:hypothetical protein